VDAVKLQEFVSGLGLSKAAEARLAALTPADYTGLASQLATQFGK